MADSIPKQEPPYGLRMPPDLKARVKAAAEANNRSMNAEIVARLEESFDVNRALSAAMVKDLGIRIERIERNLALIGGENPPEV